MTNINSVNTLNNSVGKKDNKAFMILSALGILFVVDEHLGRPIGFLYHIFPYDSFYMPLFMFISGYFFSVKHSNHLNSFCSFSWNKCKKSLFPYLLWVVFYGAFTLLLELLGVVDFITVSIKDLFINICSSGTTFGFNDPSWFVPALFSVCVFYCFIRTIFKKIWNDVFALIVFLLMGLLAVYLSNTDFNVGYHYLLLKVMFFTQFYHLGFFFKTYIEKYFDKIPTFVICSVAMLINIILLSIYGYDIRFPWCAKMGGFFTDNIFLPLITSVTGISFWLKISKVLVPMFGSNKLVNFISDNTFFIMTNHLTANAIFNGIIAILKLCGISIFSSFDISQFQSTAWYVYHNLPWINLLDFFFTLFVTLLAVKLFQKIKIQFYESKVMKRILNK